MSFSFWKFGDTPYAKAIVIPFLIVGLFCASVGSTLLVTNPKRMLDYQEAYQKNSVEFLKSEQQRTTKFISWYPRALWAFVAIGALAMIAYGMTTKPLPNAVSLAALLLCFSGLMIDHFSKERAFAYANQIGSELKKLGIVETGQRLIL
ncbi:hypothetical protein QN372_18730 [Undibacterium sp. RTI2.1]|uniref:hypothetical protein n=1 Tax=unclassified Undibacterium TaxID=2630295 RepID=UPI002B229CAE|nr:MULTISPECIES: hypothetical protein [unclassified Undibacterium]MEB0032788.1 hypothetical protein [Undibacterium sp. RTI2.1]MEB0118527.1 hypothetical protein [Undibacterium sp. RTI2.2]